ncbi:hypothetical protein ACFSQD_09630 [Flavihumibacter stibioxidans]|uniref:hypothetical protein n=1 Tax=Flavihumibacter stibioxidans TaxID=1834163 RepID=UPI00164FFD27|nr:hypothetical protein [Flavihumibacter stibioxidans]
MVYFDHFTRRVVFDEFAVATRTGEISYPSGDSDFTRRVAFGGFAVATQTGEISHQTGEIYFASNTFA